MRVQTGSKLSFTGVRATTIWLPPIGSRTLSTFAPRLRPSPWYGRLAGVRVAHRIQCSSLLPSVALAAAAATRLRMTFPSEHGNRSAANLTASSPGSAPSSILLHSQRCCGTVIKNPPPGRRARATLRYRSFVHTVVHRSYRWREGDKAVHAREHEAANRAGPLAPVEFALTSIASSLATHVEVTRKFCALPQKFGPDINRVSNPAQFMREPPLKIHP
jgi:hypothetical protein